jgi:hypothetical protein
MLAESSSMVITALKAGSLQRQLSTSVSSDAVFVEHQNNRTMAAVIAVTALSQDTSAEINPKNT